MAVGRLFLYCDNYNRNEKSETYYVFHTASLLSQLLSQCFSEIVFGCNANRLNFPVTLKLYMLCYILSICL